MKKIDELNAILAEIKRDKGVESMEYTEMLFDRGCPGVLIGFIQCGSSFSVDLREDNERMVPRIGDAYKGMLELVVNDMKKLGMQQAIKEITNEDTTKT